MIDLTTLTPEQANKIECLLVYLNSAVQTAIATYETLEQDTTFSPQQRLTFHNNKEWLKECYHLIYQKEYTNEK